jgi:uncharacterized protein YlxP (DUF503 family)
MATVVGLLHLSLHVADAMTLKDKRRRVKSFKDRVAHRFNVSVAEVGNLDAIRSAELAVAMVANDRRFVEGTLQRIENAAATHREMVLVGSDIEWL